MKRAERIKDLTSAVFTEMERIKKKVEQSGIEIINLGVGSPDRPPAPHIIEALHRGIDKMNNYRYPLEGMPELKEAVAEFYRMRFGVALDPERQVLILMGSQDGLAHLPMAYIDPGDTALVPDPGYPIYRASILLAGGNVYPMPLKDENGFLPELEAIPEEVASKAKLMWLNYPNNPVAVSANENFFKEVVKFASRHDILVCHDAAYSELAYDNFKPMSFLEIPGAMDVGVEFHSLSKTYNMAGCRLGFIVGNEEVLEALGRVKSNIDYGVFRVVQEAGIAALKGPQNCVSENASIYQKRRDVLVDGLGELGWHIPKPQASMFLWAPLPEGYNFSQKFAIKLLEETGVLVIPGVAFGNQGEGYVRIAMVREKEVLEEAVRRVGKFLSKNQ